MKRLHVAILWVALATPAPAGVRVETVDARQVAGTLVAVDGETVTLVVGGKKRAIPLDSVLEIVLPPPSRAVTPLMDVRGQAAIVTASGARMAARRLTFADGTFRFTHSLVGAASLDADAVEFVYLSTKNKTPADLQRACADLRLTRRPRDVLVVARKGAELIRVEGFLKAVAPGGIRFNWKGNDREVNPGIVRAIKLAVAGRKDRTEPGRVVAPDGSVAPFTSLRSDGKTVTIESRHLGAKTFALSKVSSIRFRSARMTPLAELKPIKVRQYGFFDTTFSYRINRSVGGGPLRVGGRTLEAGLGLHSFCELTYRLGGAYRTFVARAGIDDAVRPGGDAELSFLGDGKPLGKPIRLTGKDDPVTIRLDVTAVKEFTVRVDFGVDGLDAADHVNLAPARLIK